MSVNKSDSPALVFPFFQVLRFFRAFCADSLEVKATHRSLFYFLLETVERRGQRPRFQLNRADGMEGAGIGSKDTYTAALKQLHDWGLIRYTQGKNGQQSAIIEVLPNKSSVPELGRWQSQNQDADRDADRDAAGSLTGTTNKTIDLEPLTTLEREAAPRSRADEKKIRELEKKIAQLSAAAQIPPAAPTTSPPVAAAPPEPEPRLIPEPLAEGATIPVFVDPRLPDNDPKKWVARPRDVQMVQDYIDQHSDPAVRARGHGKAHLFFEYYESVGWTVGNAQKPSTNWHFLIRSFHFRDPLTNGTSTARSASVAASSTVVTLHNYGGNRNRPDAGPASDAPAPARLGQ